MDISHHISHLLFDNDCVIIPGLGGFVCNYQPATIHPVRHFFSPPSKTVLFNDKLKNNDGLLANQIAVAESLTYAEAFQMIEEFALETLTSVRQGNKVILKNVGVFYADAEGNMQFEPDQNINFNKDSFGLPGFVSPPVQRDFRKNIHRTEPKFENRKPIAPTKRKKSPIGWVVAGIPIVSAIVWIGLNLNVGNNLKNHTALIPPLPETGQTIEAINNVNRFSNLISEFETSPVVPKNTEEKIEAAPITSQAIITPSAKMEKVNEIGQNPPAEVLTTESAPIVTEKKYYLIAGSFESLINAEKLVQQLEASGFQPQLAGQTNNGMYRVAVAAFYRRDEALAELKKVRENYNPDVWILKK